MRRRLGGDDGAQGIEGCIGGGAGGRAMFEEAGAEALGFDEEAGGGGGVVGLLDSGKGGEEWGGGGGAGAAADALFGFGGGVEIVQPASLRPCRRARASAVAKARAAAAKSSRLPVRLPRRRRAAPRL